MDQETWTIDQAPRLSGRAAVVTGASGGLGYETALGLAAQGATVILAARNVGKLDSAVERIRKAVPDAAVRAEPLDLADLASVTRFAAAFEADGTALDILVNNAGVMAYPTRRVTRDGFEEQFGTNYLGHFALTGRLLPALLRAPNCRVVSLASLAHVQGRIALDDLQTERPYDGWKAYRQSKLAMLIFARELQRRADLHHWRLQSVAAHPGWAVTDIISNGPGQGRGGLRTSLMNLAFRTLGQTAAAEPCRSSMPQRRPRPLPAAITGRSAAASGPARSGPRESCRRPATSA